MTLFPKTLTLMLVGLGLFSLLGPVGVVRSTILGFHPLHSGPLQNDDQGCGVFVAYG